MKRIVIYLAVTFILTWGYEFGVVYPIALGAIKNIPPTAVQISIGAAMFFPAIGVVITRLVTREGFKNSLIKPKKLIGSPFSGGSFLWFLVAWFGPSLLCAIGTAIYFAANPQDFDPSMSTTIASVQQLAASATDGASSATATAAATAAGSSATSPALSDDMVRMALLTQIPTALFLGPALNIITTFGEEWGWRGYLVPKMAARIRIVPTMLITGLIWGLWHAPIIAIGHNYGTGYAGFPFAGIAAMCVFCIAVGIFLTYVTERTKSCLAAAIGHGAINSFAGACAFFSLTGGNPFVGPGPTGIIGGCAFLAVAALMLWDMHRRESAGTFHMPKAGLDATPANADEKTKRVINGR